MKEINLKNIYILIDSYNKYLTKLAINVHKRQKVGEKGCLTSSKKNKSLYYILQTFETPHFNPPPPSKKK